MVGGLVGTASPRCHRYRISAGTCTIRADQAGNATFDAAEVERTIEPGTDRMVGI